MARDLGLKGINAIIGYNDKELVWKDFASGLQEHDQSVIAAENDFDFIEPVKLASGEKVNLLSYKYPMTDKEGTVNGVFGISFIKNNHFYFHDLTDRQMQCLHLAAQGCTAKEIGKILKISYRTVEKYFELAKDRLGCKNKMHLISIYVKNTFILP